MIILVFLGIKSVILVFWDLPVTKHKDVTECHQSHRSQMNMRTVNTDLQFEKESCHFLQMISDEVECSTMLRTEANMHAAGTHCHCVLLWESVN
jgi:hypothetical protein